MKTRLLRFVAPLVALSASACGHHHVNPPTGPYWDGAFWIEPTSNCTDSSPRYLPKLRASDSLPGISEIHHADQLQAWLARHVPGGWAYGPSFNSIHATLWLRDTTQKRAAFAALESLAPPNQLFVAAHADSIVALPVRWDYAELYDWMEVLKTGHVMATGMNFWGIDAANDRIVFGIETRATLDTMVKWLVDKGIPCRLVAVEISGPIQVVVQPTFSLRRLTNVAADKHFSDAASPQWW